MPANMENATDLAIPPTVRCNQPIQLNSQKELPSQATDCYQIHRLIAKKKNMLIHNLQISMFSITREIKCINPFSQFLEKK